MPIPAPTTRPLVSKDFGVGGAGVDGRSGKKHGKRGKSQQSKGSLTGWHRWDALRNLERVRTAARRWWLASGISFAGSGLLLAGMAPHFQQQFLPPQPAGTLTLVLLCILVHALSEAWKQHREGRKLEIQLRLRRGEPVSAQEALPPSPLEPLASGRREDALLRLERHHAALRRHRLLSGLGFLPRLLVSAILFLFAMWFLDHGGGRILFFVAYGHGARWLGARWKQQRQVEMERIESEIRQELELLERMDQAPNPPPHSTTESSARFEVVSRTPPVTLTLGSSVR